MRFDPENRHEFGPWDSGIKWHEKRPDFGPWKKARPWNRSRIKRELVREVFCWSVVFWLFGSCLLIFRQLFFAGSAVVFWSFGNCFFSVSAVAFCRFGSCFVLPDAHSRTKFNCLTAQLFGSCLLIIRQLSFNFPTVVFWNFGSCLLTFRQLFLVSAIVFLSFGSSFLTFGSCILIFRQLLFAGSAVIFCRFGCYFLLVQHEVETWNKKR